MALYQQRNFLSLSDDVILMVFSELSALDLLALSKVCQRFNRIAKDHTLWRDVDCTSQPVSLKELHEIVRLGLCRDTISLKIKGSLKQSQFKENISPALLQSITKKCPNLSSLTLQECFVYADRIGIENFPKTISQFSFKNSEFVKLPSQSSWFSCISTHMVNLRSLDLSGCGWFNTHSLMALSKVENLQELNLKNCHQFGNTFAYVALSCRFGFPNLRHLDISGTSSSDMELHGFVSNRKLLESLFACDLQGVSDRGSFGIREDNVPNLRKLHLKGCAKVTKDSLTQLAKSAPASLTELDVRETSISPDEVVDFLQKRPNVNVLV